MTSNGKDPFRNKPKRINKIPGAAYCPLCQFPSCCLQHGPGPDEHFYRCTRCNEDFRGTLFEMMAGI